ncbi:DUF6603 domain-containing protein [Streptosporangium sp. CA-115845]|uniref:DUF6603 domain-containing protein n=1 Tax=Streptosporangium sp. CA-115845 TaxID=3240071 RepID=UPI003D912792
MPEPGTFERALSELGLALRPLTEELSPPNAGRGLLRELGWLANQAPQPLLDLRTDLDTLTEGLRRLFGEAELLSGDPTNLVTLPDDVARVLAAVERILDAIRAIATAPDDIIPASLREDGFREKFPRQLVEHLVGTYLTRHRPRIGFALRALGVLRTDREPPLGNRPAYRRTTLDLTKLPQTVGSPETALRDAFGWGEDTFDHGGFLSVVDDFLMSVGVDIRFGRVDGATSTGLLGLPAEENLPIGQTVPRGLKAVLLEQFLNGASVTADVRLLPLPGNGTGKPGLALVPALDGQLDTALPIGGDLTATVRSDLDLQGGVGLLVRPGEPIDVIVGFRSEDAPTHATGSIQVRVDGAGGGDTPRVLFGAKDRTRLQLRGVGGAGGMRVDAEGSVDPYVELELKGLEFVFVPDGSDGFLAAIMPSDGFAFETDLTIGVSHRDGFSFRGTSNLEIQVPAHRRIGPVEARSLTISAMPSGGTLPVTLGATFAASLGPVKALVDRVGLTVELEPRPDLDGNLGPIDLSTGFLPPSGVGLVIDAGIASGGGYLRFDTERGEYSGVLDLAFSDVLSLKALGILTTRPFSLLMLLTADFGEGLPVGFGFTLLEVGGLLGLNRGMNVAALMEGVRSGSLGSLMFPRDVVVNAPKILSDLRTYFPARPGTFLVGPMAKLAWGTPRLMHLTLGVIVEIPGNIAVVGVLRVALPHEDAPVVLLQVQFAGAIEFDKKRLYFHATLFDSRIAFIPLDGEFGLLVAWGEDANFVASLGGFHPNFEPPALPFPVPRRVTISLLNSSVARLTAQGYFAVTPNTVQFGARVDLYFKVSAFSVTGFVAFDALLRLLPFHLEVEIAAAMSVKAFGVGLFSVKIRGSLDGPSPWHIKGHGAISLLFWDLDVEFEHTFGDPLFLPELLIDVLSALTSELDRPEAWSAVAPGARRPAVTVRESAETTLHPDGVLRVSQKAVPLGLTLDKVGTQRPTGANHLTITPNGPLVRVADAHEEFAPAQFVEMSDADKLSRPAFETQRSGVDLAAAGDDLRTSGMAKRVVRYEEILHDRSFTREHQRLAAYREGLFSFLLRDNAMARSPISRASRDRLRPPGETVTVSGESYTVAYTADNRAHAPAFAGAAAAHEFRAGLIADDPAMADAVHVIPSFEVAS